MYVALHIGKTGGTYLKSRIAAMPRRFREQLIMPPAHALSIDKARRQYPWRNVVYTIREPSSLFVSAFNSRLREGQPRRLVPHTGAEKIAFSHFSTPNELAEALASPDPVRRGEAEQAMTAISHLRRCYSHYLRDVRTLERWRPRIGFIFDTNSLDDDIQVFRQRTGIRLKPDPAATEVTRHASPDGLSKDLSPAGLRALQEYWRDEYALYEWSVAMRAELMARTDMPPLPTRRDVWRQKYYMTKSRVRRKLRGKKSGPGDDDPSDHA